MAPRTSSTTPSRNGKKNSAPGRVRPALQRAPRQARQRPLTRAREAELIREAESLGDVPLFLPGNLAPRVVWSSRIQRAAERDAADLVRTPFAGDDPPLTRDEIRSFRDKIELLRVVQARWEATQQGNRRAMTGSARPLVEAVRHRQTLLRFLDLRFRGRPEVERRIAMIRARGGDAYLIQDVADLLVLCEEHGAALQEGPRGEADAAARLRALSPLLSGLLVGGALSPEAQRARRLRDAAYALVMRAGRRVRRAAEYWYGDSEKLRDYALFPRSTAAGARDEARADPAQEAEGDAIGSVDLDAGPHAGADVPPA